ncbi:hypothetical protein TSUD_12390 [Trifolium subterraneum]|nr:hypothetical protein TSUD_12390 [Trifolium subterraneum]
MASYNICLQCLDCQETVVQILQDFQDSKNGWIGNFQLIISVGTIQGNRHSLSGVAVNELFLNQGYSAVSNGAHIVEVGWNRPPQGCFKVNIDGSLLDL